MASRSDSEPYDYVLRRFAAYLAAELAPLLAGELRESRHGDEWIDQYRSPLRLPNQKFSRRHCTIVKRRVAAGLPGAHISPDGRQFFLTSAALSDEGLRPVVSTRAPVPEEDDPHGTGVYERQLLERFGTE